MPWWWAPILGAKQLSMASTAGVIWLCACVRYWPYRGVGTCAWVHNFVFSLGTVWLTISTSWKLKVWNTYQSVENYILTWRSVGFTWPVKWPWTPIPSSGIPRDSKSWTSSRKAWWNWDAWLCLSFRYTSKSKMIRLWENLFLSAVLKSKYLARKLSNSLICLMQIG